MNRNAGRPLRSGAWRPFMLALVAVVLWGGNFPVVMYALQEVGPVLLTALRFGLTALLVPLLGWPRGVPVRVLLGYTAASCLGQYLLSTVAMAMGLPAGLAALLMQSQVFWSIALAWGVEHERVRSGTLVGTALGGVGLVLMLASGPQQVPPGAFAVCVLAAACWSVANLIIRRSGVRDLLRLQAASAALACPVALAAAWGFEGARIAWPALASLPAGFYLAVGYTALLSFATAQVLWNRAVQSLGVARVAPLTLAVPLVGAALAYAWLGERYSDALLLPFLLVFGGLAWHLLTAHARQDGA